MCARRGAGRIGGIEEARELISLAAALSEEGATLDAETIARRLGTTDEDARKLLALILTASTSDGDYLSLMESEDGTEVSLAFADGLHGKRLRLTSGEMLAISAALDRLGVPVDDPIRSDISSSLSSAGLDEAMLRRMLARSSSWVDSAVLKACAQARCERRDLSFSYRRVGESDEEERHVAPLATRREDDAWYLDGFDRDREARRTFRVDRMSNVLIVAPSGEVTDVADGPARTVTVTLRDAHYLDLLNWKRLEVISRQDGVVTARVPYFGGMWLPRMIAACAGTATTNDPEVNSLAIQYAKAALSAG